MPCGAVGRCTEQAHLCFQADFFSCQVLEFVLLSSTLVLADGDCLQPGLLQTADTVHRKGRRVKPALARTPSLQGRGRLPAPIVEAPRWACSRWGGCQSAPGPGLGPGRSAPRSSTPVASGGEHTRGSTRPHGPHSCWRGFTENSGPQRLRDLPRPLVFCLARKAHL